MMKLGRFAVAGVVSLAAWFAQGGTVAYWPMVLNPETGGTSRTIVDVSGNGYDLKSALSDAQAVNTDAIPFACPPNGPSGTTISKCVEILNGTSIGVNAFERGTSAQTTSDPLVLALGFLHDFTIEGYMYVKSMKHGDNADTIICFNGVNGSGDWIWNLTEPKANSNTRQVTISMRGGGGGAGNGGVLATIDDSEIVGGWHHYALVFKYNEGSSKSRLTFYLDGVNRGSQQMANRTSNVQHDRFLLGGANSAAKKVFNAKFAFWRVSDVALSPNAMLCHQTLSTTVAYWPMNATSNFYNNAARAIVQDIADDRNTLCIRAPEYGGVSWTANDIGWTTPPNPDAELAAAGVDCRSTGMVRSGNNTTKIGDQYRAVFSTVADAPVIAATTLTNSFTVEGYVKFTTLPADSGKNQMFIYNTLGEKGGWCWNLYGPNADGNLAMKVSYNTGSNRPAVTLGDKFRAEELLNVWNHYALTFTPDNGRGQTEWRFYLNGRLLGKSNAMPAIAGYTLTSPLFYMSGAPSGANAQALRSDMTCWRVSNRVLSPTELLCGVEAMVIPDDAYVWKGSASSDVWSTGDTANWSAGGEDVAWADAKDAYFDDTFATNLIAITGEVNPASVTVIADSNFTVDFNSGRSSAIGTGCTNFVKRGFGTFELSYGGNTGCQLLKGACPIAVREGCLKVSAVNSNGGLGDASVGYEAKVYEHATLWFFGRNAIGSAKAGDANDSVFTVYTNGTFNLKCNGSDAGIQALGTLDLLGGDIVFPSYCHSLGYLMVRNRLTLGARPDRRAYVFPAILDGPGGHAYGGVTIGTNIEFRVDDITGDAASDAIFNCAVLQRTRDNWNQKTCGFRKTGAGTMELNGKFLGGSADQVKPKGVIAIEAGELKVNIDYSGPSKFTVADGAYLSGTGKVEKVEFAVGAGVRVDATKTDLLELAGTIDFAGAGTIEIANVPQADVENLKVNCAKITGTPSGTANLANWTVKVNGAACPRAVVRMNNGFLKAAVVKGTFIVFR